MTVEGVGEVASAITRLGARIASRMRRRHEGMLGEMIDLAKSRVPVDTGTLQNGITGEPDGDAFTFRAEAIDPKDGENYARDVEFGHATRGAVIVADTDYFEGRAPRSSGAGGRVEPDPFFFNSAEEVLHRHGHELGEAAGDAGRDDGWEVS